MLSDIPSELKRLTQWVCALSTSKAPMKAFAMEGASTNDPLTWSDFNTAEALVNKGIYDNIGFVFADNGYVGIDIDNGFDDDGFVSLIGSDIINKCKSYTEKSRSGRGFHIIVKGDLPFKGRNNRAGVEIYKTGRYFIMTGDIVIYTNIVENQQAIDYVLEKYFKDVKESRESDRKRIYEPIWENCVEGNRIKLRPTYPDVENGSRNICMTSLAGNLHTQGWDKRDIFNELKVANASACHPPLSINELMTICTSVCKYSR